MVSPKKRGGGGGGVLRSLGRELMRGRGWVCVAAALLFGAWIGHEVDVLLEAATVNRMDESAHASASPGLARLIVQAEAIASAIATAEASADPTEQPWADSKSESLRRISSRAEATAAQAGASAAQAAPQGTVLILCPMRDRAHALGRFFNMLTQLTYPKELISVAILEGDSKDSTYSTAQISLNNLLDVHGFRRATIIKRDYAFNVDRAHRHDYHVQQERRSTLSRLRNFLFISALYDEDFVLWVDSDLAWYPRDIVEVMMAVDKDMVVPHCLLGFNTYDYNSWQETRESWALQSTMQPEELLYEGYLEEAGVDTQRLHMSELQYRCESDEGKEKEGSHHHHHQGSHDHNDNDGSDSMCKEDGLVKLDGVGGAIILMKASLHREGVYFPPYPFNHSIETEGLAKMSSEMGAQPYGMPMVKVWHK